MNTGGRRGASAIAADEASSRNEAGCRGGPPCAAGSTARHRGRRPARLTTASAPWMTAAHGPLRPSGRHPTLVTPGTPVPGSWRESPGRSVACQHPDIVSVFGIGFRECVSEEPRTTSDHDSHGVLDEQRGSEVCTIMGLLPPPQFHASLSTRSFPGLAGPALASKCPRAGACTRPPRPTHHRSLYRSPRMSRLKVCRRFPASIVQDLAAHTPRRGGRCCSDGTRAIAQF